MKIIGIEIANSSVKAFTKEQNIVYPNTIREVKDTEMTISLLRFGRDIYNFEGVNYEIGHPTETGSGSKSQNRYKQSNFRRETILALSQFVETENEVLKVITGLSSEQSKNPNVIRELRENILGDYTVTVNGDQKKVFSVVDLEVIAQPLGTLISFLFDVNGVPKNTADLDKNAIVIDIGWGTTDIVAFEENKITERESYAYAMSDFNRRMMDEINVKYPDAKISNSIKSLYELDLKVRQGDVIELPRGDFDITEIKEKVKGEVAETIHQKFNTMGFNLDNFYYIILTGGGAKALEKELIELFKDDKRVIVPKNAQIANAKGFYIFGYNHWHRV